MKTKDLKIEFRGKSIESNEWVYGDLFSCNEPIIIVPNKAKNSFTEIRVIKKTIGQFVGKRDEKGKKIFHGDILKIKTYHNEFGNYTVIWEQGRCGFHLISSNLDRDEYGIFCRNIANNDKRKVIGNIYDNPELTKQKK